MFTGVGAPEFTFIVLKVRPHFCCVMYNLCSNQINNTPLQSLKLRACVPIENILQGTLIFKGKRNKFHFEKALFDG